MSATRTLALTGAIALAIGLGVVGCGEDEEVSVAPASSSTAPTVPAPTSDVESDRTGDDLPPPSEAPSQDQPDEPDGGRSQQSEFARLDPSTIPEAPAPGRLADAILPTESDGVVALFVALPVELFGAEKDLTTAPAGGVAAEYPVGARTTPVGFQAYDVPASFYGEILPEPTADHVVALFATGADWEVEAVGHEGDRFWVEWLTTAGGEGFDAEETIFSLVFGDAGRPWVFVVNADDAAARDELLEVFVAASIAVPEPSPPTGDEATARAALLEPSDLGPDWTSRIKLPPDAGFPDVLARTMSAEPVCSTALDQLAVEAPELSGLLELLTIGATAHAESATLVARREQTFEVEHTVAVFEDADDAGATIDELEDLGWIDCLSAVYGALLQAMLASELPEVVVTLDDVVRRSVEHGDDAVALRFETSVELPDGSTVPVAHDVSIVVVGRSMSALVQTSFGGVLDDEEVDEIIALGVDLVGEVFAPAD